MLNFNEDYAIAISRCAVHFVDKTTWNNIETNILDGALIIRNRKRYCSTYFGASMLSSCHDRENSPISTLNLTERIAVCRWISTRPRDQNRGPLCFGCVCVPALTLEEWSGTLRVDGKFDSATAHALQTCNARSASVRTGEVMRIFLSAHICVSISRFHRD